MVDSNEGKRLIGRSEVIESIVGTLRGGDSGGSLVVAVSGLGKSAIAHTVASSLGADSGLVRLAASRSLAAVPFGALAPLLSDLSMSDISSPIAVIRAVIKFLKQVPVPSGELPIIIVDDAHVLDESSAAVLAQVVTAGAARLFALSRGVPGPPQEILSLWHDGLLTRFDLEPLTAAEVHELCIEVLGAEVLRSASAAFARASAGNPMFLLALISQAQQLNHLVQRRGVWILSGEPPSADVRLSDLVKTELMRLTRSEREVLETVALAEPIPLWALRQLAQASEVDALEAGKFITVDADPERLVRPAHPLYGEVLRKYTPAGRSLALRKKVVELMDTEPTSVEALLRYVSWALESGSFVADQQLLRAAVVANKLFQTSFALRAAEAVTEPKFRLAALVEMARAYYSRGELDRAQDLLEGALEKALDLRTVTSAALLCAQLRIRRGDPLSQLRRDAEAWSEATERIAAEDHTGTLAHAADLSRSGSRLLHAYVSILEGQYDGVAAELRDLATDPRGSDETRLVACALLGELLTATGKPEAGAQIHADAMDLVRRNEQRFLSYYEFVLSRYAISLVSSGRWDEVQTLMTRYLEDAPQMLAYFGGAVNLTTGLVLIRQGQLHSALGQLSPAIEALRETDLQQLLPLALGLGAYAAALLGQRSQALEYAEDFFRVPYSGSRQLYLLGQAHAAAARVAVEGFKAAGGDLLQLAETSAGSGMRSVQQVILELAIRLGANSELKRLSEIAAGNEGAEAEILFRFAQAALNKDTTALREVSEAAAQARYGLIAADCLAYAISILQSQGHGQRARHVRVQLAERVSRLEGTVLYELEDLELSSSLTRRERDIARLVLQARSNREIADEFSVSVRTVEGHLYRMFVKLGINRREELTNAHIGRRS